MKTIKLIACSVGIITVSTVASLAGPTFVVGVGVGVPAPVVVTPAPVVTVEIGVPDYYVWDGVEFVGVVGTQYCYLGPDNVWIVCDPVRLARFHAWENHHEEWRTHAIVNVKYRHDDHGHLVPLRANDHDHDRGDNGYHHDKGHDHGH